jgi:hypothetical protein
MLFQTYRLENALTTILHILKPNSKYTPNMKITNAIKTRYSLFLYGHGSGAFRPVVYAPNYHNELEAVKNRVVKPTPVPNNLLMTRFIKWLSIHKRLLFGGLASAHVTPMPFETYIKNSNASTAVKEILKKTYLELNSQGITPQSTLSPDQLYKFTKRSGFVKVEKNVYRSRYEILDKAPRLIQGATPEFIVLVGPFIAALQARFKKQWNVKNSLVFTSGVSQLDLGNKIMDHNGEKVENDVSAWDASLCEQMCDFEATMCRKWFHCPVAVYDLMKANVHTHGKTMHGIKYRVRGTRKSGDPYTSLFNSFWNAMMHVYIIYTENRHHTLRQVLDSIVMLVQGDDNAMSIGANLKIPDFNIHMLAFGFKSKCFIRQNALDLEFCSNRLYRVEEGWTFGPKPGRVLTKLGYFINPPAHVSPMSLMRGNALGLKPACYHIPILKIVIDAILKKTEGYEAYVTSVDDWKMTGANCTPNYQTAHTLYHCYGWNQNFQKDLMHCYENTPFGQDIMIPAAAILYDTDTNAAHDLNN